MENKIKLSDILISEAERIWVDIKTIYKWDGVFKINDRAIWIRRIGEVIDFCVWLGDREDTELTDNEVLELINNNNEVYFNKCA